jgi:hypothetical protein
MIIGEADQSEVVEPCDGLGAFAVFEPHTTQLSAEPSVEIAQRRLTLGMAVIRHPDCNEAVHFGHDLVEGDAAVAPRDLPQSIFGPLQALGRSMLP